MQSEVLRSLLEQTWKSPVFGDSFGPDVSLKTLHIVQQIDEIAQTFHRDLREALTVGIPKSSQRDIEQIVAQIAPKTVSFCPALAAGELHDIAKLSAFSVAIGLMYWGDQTMDRGDPSMPLAIRLFAGAKLAPPKHLANTAKSQAKALAGMEEKINFFARAEDAPFVLPCFAQQVLLNEVRVHELSKQYLAVANRDAFLTKHAKELAWLITQDAGFSSVSSSLYALYRQENPSLPPLSAVHADRTITDLIQMCSVVVRIFDELGDWDIDAGHHPKWGVFSINPFNQPNKDFLSELLLLGNINNPKMVDSFIHFHDSPQARMTNGQHITGVLLGHVRNFVANLPPTKFDLYVTLCKRVLEIGYINRAGDVNLAG